MSNILNGMKRDPSMSESYNIGADVKRVSIVVLLIAIALMAIAFGRPGDKLNYVSDVKVSVVKSGNDEHYDPLKNRRNKIGHFKVYWVKFHGTYADGSELTITQKTNHGLSRKYAGMISQGDKTMKLYRSKETGRPYITELEEKEAIAEYRKINRGLIKETCLNIGIIMFVIAAALYRIGAKKQKKAKSYIPETPMSFENEEQRRADQQRMYDEASKIFD